MVLNQGTQKKARLLLLTVVGMLLVLLAGCGSSPEDAVSGFFGALNEGKPEKVAEYVCGDIVVPPLPQISLRNPNYQTIDDDGTTAHVRVRGEIWINILGGTIKKTLDFTATATKDRDKWCVTKDSIKSFLEEMAKFR